MPAAKNHCRRTQNFGGNSNRIVKNLRWVIFPEDYWVKHWDAVIITLTITLMFVIPFQIGVSFGSYLNDSTIFRVVLGVINAVFFVDNFVYFFRAYRTENGTLIIDLKKIRRNYFRTYCIPNFLSTIPTTVIFYLGHISYEQMKTETDSSVNLVFWLLPLVKVLRFIRIPFLLRSSQFVKDFKARHNSQNIALLGYLFFLIITSHIFACTWSFVALIESSISAPMESLLSSPNWISYWYTNNYEEGGLNPANPDAYIDRYILSLFWAVQTITSIGYGNVLPFTVAEYCVSAALMLLSGVMWAYIIGGFVGVASGLGRKEGIYGTRLDEANELIKDFESDEDKNDIFFGPIKSECSRSIKSYIHTQNSRSHSNVSVSTIFEAYPVLPSLTPNLQLTSCLIVMRKYLETIPYLSSKYLTMEEQSEVAMQCAFIDFAAGERVVPRKTVGHLGPGVLVMARGLAVRRRNPGFHPTRVVASGMPFGENSVLLENNTLLSPIHDELRYVTFSSAVFIPRKAILEALRSEMAWKGCGRWRYLIALLLLLPKDSDVPVRKTVKVIVSRNDTE